MPCWTVQKSTIELQNPNAKLLRQALESAGFACWVKNETGFSMERFHDRSSVTLRDGLVIIAIGGRKAKLAALTSEVKRAYSAQVVRAASQRFGWTLKQVGANRYQAQRRG